MKYRVRNAETNEILENNDFMLSTDGELFRNGRKVDFKYEIQLNLNLVDRYNKPIHVGDALSVKEEWLPKGQKIWLSGLERHTEPYNFDEVLLQITTNENERMYYWVLFKSNGNFLTNKDMGYTDAGENDLRAIPYDDLGLLQLFANKKMLEVIYNVSMQDKWLADFE